MFGRPLFRRSDLGDYLREQDAAAERFANENVRPADLAKPDEEIVEKLLARTRIQPLTVDFENPVKDVKEAPLSLPDGFGDRITIDWVCATRAFSFTGDAELLELKPAQLADPPEGEVRDGLILIGAVGQPELKTLKHTIDQQQRLLRLFVEASAAQVEAHNAALPAKLGSAVARRKARLVELARLKSLL